MHTYSPSQPDSSVCWDETRRTDNHGSRGHSLGPRHTRRVTIRHTQGSGQKTHTRPEDHSGLPARDTDAHTQTFPTIIRKHRAHQGAGPRRGQARGRPATWKSHPPPAPGTATRPATGWWAGAQPRRGCSGPASCPPPAQSRAPGELAPPGLPSRSRPGRGPRRRPRSRQPGASLLGGSSQAGAPRRRRSVPRAPKDREPLPTRPPPSPGCGTWAPAAPPPGPGAPGPAGPYSNMDAAAGAPGRGAGQGRAGG